MANVTKPTERASTGIQGLDDILRGGFVRNRFYLIEGEPGTGKTTLGMQFLLEGARHGEKVLYIALSETNEELREVAGSHAWQLDDISIFELSALEQQLALESQNTLFHPAEVELTQTTQILLSEIERISPSRLVLDSLSELRQLAQNPLRFRRQILALKQFFAKRNCTVLILDDLTSDAPDLQVQSIAHGVICLQRLSPEYGAERRRLSVRKLRGVDFRGGYHDYVIRQGGLSVFPRLVAAEHRNFLPQRSILSGLPEMDELLGAGLDSGTSTLILGPSGSGKSLLALQFVRAATLRKENVAMYVFDENVGTACTRAEGLGIPLRDMLSEGYVQLSQIDPAELSPGEFAQKIRSEVEVRRAKLVVIDSLNGYLHSMPAEKYMMIQLHELLSYLSQQDVTTILVYTQHGMFGQMSSPIELTYISDTVILLRYFEAFGAVRKAISVIKKRTGPHEDTIREFSIGGQGLQVGAPLQEFSGILTGVPTYKAYSREALTEVRSNYDNSR